MKRVLVLCTHNSARSQMAEGWLRHLAKEKGLELEVWSAGTEKTIVKRDAIAVMREVGIDISHYTSKALCDVPIPWRFDVVMTVCDHANETCPAFPAQATRLHVSFPDPSGQSLERWRDVRDDLKEMAEKLVTGLEQNRIPSEEELRPKQLA
jgi:arsenate reductase (thioredoxin)